MGRTVAAAGDRLDTSDVSARPAGGRDLLDGLFALAIVSSLVVTLLVLLHGIDGHVLQPAADLVLDTTAAVVCVTITTLAWARYRERRVVAAAYHAAAFMALAAAYMLGVLVSLQHSVTNGGLSEPENAQVLVFAIARIAAAVLFVIAGSFTWRRSYGWSPAWILVAPTLAVLLSELVARVVGPPPDALQIVTFPDASGLPDVAPFGALIYLVTSILFFIGAFVSRRLWRDGRAVIDGWIAIGLVFAGFAELHAILYPSAHPGQVSTADLLRLACSGCLLAGLASALRADQRELRSANIELEQLRDAEVEHAAAEERNRLARELHDGLAQDLWLAKLRAGELVGMPGLPAEARRAAESAVEAIDIGLTEAREAVAALRSSAHSDSGFCSVLQQSVEELGDRFGLRVEFAFEGEHTSTIPARTQAEMLRIAQEAVANVAKHAEATLVGVRLSITGGRITLRIADNGQGFSVASPSRTGFGMTTMQERAALIGGTVRVTSSPDAGTLVVASVPLAPPPTVRPVVPRGAHDRVVTDRGATEHVVADRSAAES
jgi:signal transduction histidine kinase